MAKRSFEIVFALRTTAQNINVSHQYQWGHMGCCNCGFLAQYIAQLSKTEIHAMAMERSGDWTEQLQDYCPTSGLRMDHLITTIISFGFDADDLKNLERLSDNSILGCLPRETKLFHNRKEDVVLYLNIWADKIERELLLESESTDSTPRSSFSLADDKADSLLEYYPG